MGQVRIGGNRRRIYTKLLPHAFQRCGFHIHHAGRLKKNNAPGFATSSIILCVYFSVLNFFSIFFVSFWISVRASKTVRQKSEGLFREGGTNHTNELSHHRRTLCGRKREQLEVCFSLLFGCFFFTKRERQKKPSEKETNIFSSIQR